MCVGIPMKIVAIDGTVGTVEELGVTREVGLDLLEEPKIGNYVIVHAGYALEELNPEEAKETLALLRKVKIIPDEPIPGVDTEPEETAAEADQT